MKLEERLAKLTCPSKEAAAAAVRHWNHIAKPLHSLGLLEDAIIKIAAIQGTEHICLDKKALVIMCADNGIVAEGVTQTGQEVTAVVTENFTRGESCVCLMAERAGAEVIPVDIGVASDLETCGVKYPLRRCKIAYGTKNFYKEPAMTRQETVMAIETGIRIAADLKKQGFRLLAVGEMGIGNTATSSAVASVLLGEEPAVMTGRGAGLSDQGLKLKQRVIENAIQRHRPNRKDAVDVLSKVGGLDLAGLAGVCMGGALYQIPVVLDGVITAAAALAAESLAPGVSGYLLASHVSAEPAGRRILEKLGLTPVIEGQMCLGEGTGAMALMPLLDMAADIYTHMRTFQDIHMEEYKPL